MASRPKAVIGLLLITLIALSANPLVAPRHGPQPEHGGLPPTRGDSTFSAAATSDSELIGTCEPLTVTVTFHSTVVGGTPPYSYSWDFGENGTSHDPNPRHTYMVMFVEYHVFLRVADANKAVATNSTDFKAVPPPCGPTIGRIPPTSVLFLGSLGITVIATTVLFWLLRRPRRLPMNRETRRPGRI